jgi:acetolactate synthase small subunit
MCFCVTAQAEPGVLARIVALFAKRGLTPTDLRAEWNEGGAGTLKIYVQMAGMDPDLAAYIAQCMRAIVAVSDVQVSGRPRVSA